MVVYRWVRDEIKAGFGELYYTTIKPETDREAEELKEIVKEKYGQIAKQSEEESASCCCGTSCCTDVDYTIFSEDYSKSSGYNPDADLGLGCGIPTDYAGIKPGQHVLDLGSGAGNDCFVARSLVGESGKVTGLDFTDEMIEKARRNNEKMGYTNIEFIKGDIEQMPLMSDQFDVVLSNCVLNLVPDKSKAFHEIFRVLHKGGHFCISDVVIRGNLPENIRKSAEMYAGCVSGAIQLDAYLALIEKAGFKDVVINKQKEIPIPDYVLANSLTADALRDYKARGGGVYSVTVSAIKNW
jgi:SAM-dependent methyltransferase